MRIYSLKVRDDAKEDPGYAVVKLSGLELIALNNILSFDRFDLNKLEEKLRNGGKRNADSGGD